MRILHVLDHSIPLHSGYSFRTSAILRQQHAMGWTTFHLTSPKHYATQALEERVNGLHFYRTERRHGTRNAVGGLHQLAVVYDLSKRLHRLAREIRPDIIHAHSPALNGLAALRVGRRLRLPVVYELRALWEDAAVDHGTCREGSLRYRLSRGMETFVLRRARQVTTICEGLREEIQRRGIDPKKVTVVPNAVDLSRFPWNADRDAGLARELGLEGAVVLGFIGSFYAYEGVERLLEALPAIAAEQTSARVLLVGGGPSEELLKRRCAELGIADRVVFAGRVDHAIVSRYYSVIDILAYPRHSNRLTELVTPLKPLEAMALGKLVVASDVGGHRELIQKGTTGELFRPGDPGDLARTVLGLLRSRQAWPERRRLARSYVEAERTWPEVVSRYQSVYDRALST